MPYQPFTDTKPTYHSLDDGYALRSAPDRDFGIHYAIYRNVNPEFDEFLDYGADLQGRYYCFWILHRERRIGGVVLRPNHIEGLFLEPPHVDTCRTLRAILPLLRSWSDTSRTIEAVDVIPGELEVYQRLGFEKVAARRVYIRPTEPFEVVWPADLDVAPPMARDVGDVAELFQAAYRQYPAGWGLARYSVEDWRRRTGRRLEQADVPEVCHRASTLIREQSSGRAIGCCIVRPEVRYAKVQDIGVHPDHRRGGVGARMLRTALSALYGEFAVLKFGVAAGNPAEAFYYELGFLPGVTQHKLTLIT
ncbi:MAG: GNAT family N-acetyltransferase [Phycisphaeraceae bacterium]|nr:GNAT family N-acetyltransferase [Phycisphaeraceae bacterium]